MSLQRFTKERPCPICRGWDRMDRGEGKRCHGYISSDRSYAHCAQVVCGEPYDTGLYAHRLEGKCKCGETHGESTNGRHGTTYHEYRDENGTPLYRVARVGSGPSKKIWQEHANGSGWVKGLNGARLVPYRLPELRAADPDTTIYIAEGEKAVDALAQRGLVATCNPMGAKKWKGPLAAEAAKVLRGRNVVVLPDDDVEGRAHRDQVVAALTGVAASVRVVELFKGDTKRDVYDWFATGRTAAELVEIVQAGNQDLDKSESDERDSDSAKSTNDDPWKSALATALADVKAKLDTNTKKRPPLFTDATALLAKSLPPAQWQIDGLVTKGGQAVSTGEPKAAIKTWSAIECALAIATGTKAFGEFYAHRGRAAIFFAEDHEQAVRNRIRALMAGANRTLEPGYLFTQPRGEFIDVLDDEDLAWVVASVRQLGQPIDLLVLDPLRDIHSGEEDKSDSMSRVMRRLRLLGEILGCTVWVSHHAPKSTKDTEKRRPGQNGRGSSAIHGATDSGFYIAPLEGDGTNVFKARVTSQVKSGRSSGVFDLELAIVDDDNGEATSATWTFSRTEFKKGPSKHQADDDAVFTFVRELAMRGEVLSRTALRTHDSRPIPERRLTAALDRLIDSDRLALSDGRVTVPGSEKSE